MAKASQIFDEQFLTLRSKLLEIAAALDRLDRAAAQEAGSPEVADPRRELIEQAIAALGRGAVGAGDRAETLQQLFSRSYDPQWRQTLQV